MPDNQRKDTGGGGRGVLMRPGRKVAVMRISSRTHPLRAVLITVRILSATLLVAVGNTAVVAVGSMVAAHTAVVGTAAVEDSSAYPGASPRNPRC